MRIVRPTNPPSMAVIVDTIVFGDVMLIVSPPEVNKDRVDIVYANGKLIGVMVGPSVSDNRVLSSEWPLPTLPEGSRPLAKLYILRSQSAIYATSIEEYP